MKQLFKTFLIPVIAALLLVSVDAFAFTYSTTLKNARQDAITTAIGAAGYIEIGPTGMASVCVTITLSNPAAAASSGGVWTMAGAPKSATASGTCTAGEARVRASGAVDVITGLTVTATGGGGNITLNNVSIASGQTVTLTGLTITSGN